MSIKKILVAKIIAQPKANRAAIKATNTPSPSDGLLTNVVLGGIYHHRGNSTANTSVSNFSQFKYNDQSSGRWISSSNQLFSSQKLLKYFKYISYPVWKGATVLAEARTGAAGAGILKNAFVIGGRLDAGVTTTTCSYNGTAWSSATSIVAAREFHGACGMKSDCFISGGENLATLDSVERFIGGVLQTSASMPVVLKNHTCSGGPTDALVMGGENTGLNSYLYWDKMNTWETGPDISSSKGEGLSSCGTGAMALLAGGEDSSTYLSRCLLVSRTTNFSPFSWTSASVGSLITARQYHCMAGSPNEALVWGGTDATNILQSSETFNGTTWSAGPNLSTKRKRSAAAGTANNCISAGGTGENSAMLDSCEMLEKSAEGGFLWFHPNSKEIRFLFHNDDISAWESASSLSTNRVRHASSGTRYQAFAFGGQDGSTLQSTEEFNGQTWTSSGNMIEGTSFHAGCGGNDSALSTGGLAPTIGKTSKFTSGSGWAAGPNLLYQRSHHGAAGSSEEACIFAGHDGGTYRTGTETLSQNQLYLSGTTLVGLFDSAFGGTATKKYLVGGFTTYYHTDFQIGTFITWEAGAVYPLANSCMRAVGKSTEDILAVNGVNTIAYYSFRFNGVAWAASPNTLYDRFQSGFAGYPHEAILFGGISPTSTYPPSEEYHEGAVSILGVEIT